MRIIIAGLVLLFGFGFAQDIRQINDSSRALVGALESSFRASVEQQYLPNCCFVIIVSAGLYDGQWQQGLAQLRTLLTALAPTIRGLRSSDNVVVMFRAGFGEDAYELVLAANPASPGAITVWRDGRP
jgi:hypothetical protein